MSHRPCIAAGIAAVQEKEVLDGADARACKTTSLQSVVNVPPQAASSYSMGGAQATSLDMDDSDKEWFHEATQKIIMRCSPQKQCLDPLWQASKSLHSSVGSLWEKDTEWWPLLFPLMEMGCGHSGPHQVAPGCMEVVHCTHVPSHTHSTQHWPVPRWDPKRRRPYTLAAGVHKCASVHREAMEGRTWHPCGTDGGCFSPQVSQLVDTFVSEMGVELREGDIVSCWNQPPDYVPLQRKYGPFSEVIEYLNVLAWRKPMQRTWDELVCPPPAAEPSTPHCTSQIGYIKG